MAHVVVSAEELREACAEKESTLGRLLKTWEKQVMEAQIYHEKMKAVPKDLDQLRWKHTQSGCWR